MIEIPVEDTAVISRICESIEKAETFYITWHARPDGDACGAGLFLKTLLEKNQKKADIISPDPVPAAYGFLVNAKTVLTELPEEKRDILFVLDCSDEGRMENASQLIKKAATVISIDHHQENTAFGDIRYIRADSSSTCELVLNIALFMEKEIDISEAECIYTGILTDTNRFQEQNTTVRSHKTVAWLIKKGVQPVKVSSNIYGSQPVAALKLLSMAIGSVRLLLEGKVGCITVTPEMFSMTWTGNEDLEGVINYARNIRGVEVGLLLRVIEGLNGIKVSLRSKGNVNVGKVAAVFGGGGHHNAAGCLIEGDFDTVLLRLSEVLTKELSR